MSATLTADPVTRARHEAIGGLTITALTAGLPLPGSLFIPVYGTDAEAGEVMKGYAQSCELHGIRYRLIDDQRRFGLEIDAGGAVARWVHIRDHATAGAS
jgi:hypothetical protein